MGFSDSWCCGQMGQNISKRGSYDFTKSELKIRRKSVQDERTASFINLTEEQIYGDKADVSSPESPQKFDHEVGVGAANEATKVGEEVTASVIEIVYDKEEEEEVVVRSDENWSDEKEVRSNEDEQKDTGKRKRWATPPSDVFYDIPEEISCGSASSKANEEDDIEPKAQQQQLQEQEGTAINSNNWKEELNTEFWSNPINTNQTPEEEQQMKCFDTETGEDIECPSPDLKLENEMSHVITADSIDKLRDLLQKQEQGKLLQINEEEEEEEASQPLTSKSVPRVTFGGEEKQTEAFQDDEEKEEESLHQSLRKTISVNSDLYYEPACDKFFSSSDDSDDEQVDFFYDAQEDIQFDVDQSKTPQTKEREIDTRANGDEEDMIGSKEFTSSLELDEKSPSNFIENEEEASKTENSEAIFKETSNRKQSKEEQNVGLLVSENINYEGHSEDSFANSDPQTDSHFGIINHKPNMEDDSAEILKFSSTNPFLNYTETFQDETGIGDDFDWRNEGTNLNENSSHLEEIDAAAHPLEMTNHKESESSDSKINATGIDFEVIQLQDSQKVQNEAKEEPPDYNEISMSSLNPGSPKLVHDNHLDLNSNKPQDTNSFSLPTDTLTPEEIAEKQMRVWDEQKSTEIESTKSKIVNIMLTLNVFKEDIEGMTSSGINEEVYAQFCGSLIKIMREVNGISNGDFNQGVLDLKNEALSVINLCLKQLEMKKAS